MPKESTGPVCGFDPLNDEHYEALREAALTIAGAIQQLRTVTGCSDRFVLQFLEECIEVGQ